MAAGRECGLLPQHGLAQHRQRLARGTCVGMIVVREGRSFILGVSSLGPGVGQCLTVSGPARRNDRSQSITVLHCPGHAAGCLPVFVSISKVLDILATLLNFPTSPLSLQLQLSHTFSLSLSLMHSSFCLSVSRIPVWRISVWRISVSLSLTADLDSLRFTMCWSV